MSVGNRLAFVGLGLAVFAWIAPEFWKGIPNYVSYPLLGIGFLLVVVGVWPGLIRTQRVPDKAVMPPKYIPMREAATRLYEAGRKHESRFVYFADRLPTEDARLGWLATYIARRAQVLGKRPPSRDLEPFSLTSGTFRDFGEQFWISYAKEPTYVDVHVDKVGFDDLLLKVPTLKVGGVEE